MYVIIRRAEMKTECLPLEQSISFNKKKLVIAVRYEHGKRFKYDHEVEGGRGRSREVEECALAFARADEYDDVFMLEIENILLSDVAEAMLMSATSRFKNVEVI